MSQLEPKEREALAMICKFVIAHAMVIAGATQPSFINEQATQIAAELMKQD